MCKFIKPFLLIAMVLVFPTGMQDLSAQQLKSRAVQCGADQPERYLPQLRNQQVGLVGNISSLIGDQHLVDYLLEQGIDVKVIFCPEHGFRETSEAGARIDNHLDPLTGLPVVSLYGSSKKPERNDVAHLDVLLFDIQDVGARFYTYISTLHYVMESAAENDVRMVVLDRPNPNGFYVDGPVRKTGFESFVGMHPVPVVHGMTIGEYARMINGEGWLGHGVTCDLEVIPCLNYDHQTEYVLPVAPSPNLPNQMAVYLYPSLCFFEGTVVSIGRGTQIPFQLFGHPDMDGELVFRPLPVQGASLNPKFNGQLCYGTDLRTAGVNKIINEPRLYLEWVIQAWNELGRPVDFFTSYFDLLAGTDVVRLAILSGQTAGEIRRGWQNEIADFMLMRKKYLLY